MHTLFLRLMISIVIILGILIPRIGYAEEVKILNQITEVISAEVVEVLSTSTTTVPGTHIETTLQYIKARLLEGSRAGDIVTIKNDVFELKEGQSFFANRMFGEGGEDIISVRDADRRVSLVILTILFCLVIAWFGGKQGMRSLLSLALTFVVIMLILLPLLKQGYSPVMVSVILGSIVLFGAITFTHGLSKKSLIAFAGTMAGVCVTGILAWISVSMTNLTGFSSEDTVYLNFSTQGFLDLKGLLLASIIIGVLGVLDDIAITQVSVVGEIKKAGKSLTQKEVFSSAMNVGRDHVGALVNTLVLAYTGVALPLLLLFSGSSSDFFTIINQELFATEIVRTIVGSIGLLLTVPFSTLFAVLWLSSDDHVCDDTHSHHHHHHHHH